MIPSDPNREPSNRLADRPVAEPVDEHGQRLAPPDHAGGAVALAYATKRSQRPGLWTAMGIVSIVLAVWMGLQALIGMGQPIFMRMMSGLTIPVGPTTTLAPATLTQDGATLSPTSRDSDRLPDLDATRIWVELISPDAGRSDVQVLLTALRAHGAAMFPDHVAIATPLDISNRVVSRGTTLENLAFIELKDARIEYNERSWSIYTRSGRLLEGSIDLAADDANAAPAPSADVAKADRFENLPMGAPLPTDPNAAPATIAPFAGWAISWGMVAVQVVAQVVGLVLAGVLLWAGIEMLRDRRRGLSIHRRWAWLKIIWVVLVVMMLEPWMMSQMMSAMFAQMPAGTNAAGGAGNANPMPVNFSTWMAVFSALMNGIFALIYPILVLVLTRLKMFKAHAETLSR